MPPDQQRPDRGPRNSSGQRAKGPLLLAHIRFARFPLQSKGRTPWGWKADPTSLPLPPTSRNDLRLDGCLEYSHSVKALFIFKHPSLLRVSNPGPTEQQLASLTTIRDERLYYQYSVE
ncbi:hypothetical protein TNCV_115861 [Trichonephila clavipes]|nr:hypothetical protein TNCV_115861 [Trichonephila clavipes]